MATARDLGAEVSDNSERQYAYDFDGVLRKYMLRTFLSFLPTGRALELGCYEGDFTVLLKPHFADLTVVEAVGPVLDKAKAKIGPPVKFLQGVFEDIDLPESSFDAIFLVHVLEHIDDPVLVLKRINRWLSPSGRLFLACPNANAASRQVAVRMGIIDHNAAITPGEFAQGHRRTYSLDTFERDARLAGLKVLHTGGVFFKPLANFQFDRLMKTDIISPQYLEGCYSLGMTYPDLCASIYLVCGKGFA